MPFVATSSRLRQVQLLVMFAALAAGGVFIALHARPGNPLDAFVGWGCLFIFGLGGILALMRVLGPRKTLTVESRGITWTERSDQTIPWSAITGIQTRAIGKQRIIMLTLAQPDAYPPTSTSSRIAKVVNRAVSSSDVHLSVGDTDRSVDEVLAAISLYWPPRER
jgi:hypothetical protein